MFRKIAGIFILLCFLALKHSPLHLFDGFKPVITFDMPDETGEEMPDDEKSSKEVESTDDDFIHQPLVFINHIIPDFKKVDHYICLQVSSAYVSLPYPPPDFCL